jgi:hypothetical protein
MVLPMPQGVEPSNGKEVNAKFNENRSIPVYNITLMSADE